MSKNSKKTKGDNEYRISTHPDGWGDNAFDVMIGKEEICTCEKQEHAELIIKALNQLEEI